jgi:hypothetical protein
MSEALSLQITNDSLLVRSGQVDIARYVFEPHAPASEAPKPFLHPLKTLKGAPLTVTRPWDHRWHKGLQMTWSHVSGENFWGGPTYTPGEGYQWIENLGTVKHESFTAITDAGPEVSFTERLRWLSSTGEHWIDEERTHTFHSVDPDRGIWSLDFHTTLTNARTSNLEFGSPSTHGRDNAGYTGFFWRGPRSWTGGPVTSSTGTPLDEIMGSPADWVAFSGEHDEHDGGATVLAFAGNSSSHIPIKWFVRNEPFAALSPSPSFDEEIVLSPGETLTLDHRYVFIDQVCQAEDLALLAAEFTP